MRRKLAPWATITDAARIRVRDLIRVEHEGAVVTARVVDVASEREVFVEIGGRALGVTLAREYFAAVRATPPGMPRIPDNDDAAGDDYGAPQPPPARSRRRRAAVGGGS